MSTSLWRIYIDNYILRKESNVYIIFILDQTNFSNLNKNFLFSHILVPTIIYDEAIFIFFCTFSNTIIYIVDSAIE